MLSPKASLIDCFPVVYTHLLSVLDVGRSGLQFSASYSGVSVGVFLLVLALEVIHDKLCLLADSSDLPTG